MNLIVNVSRDWGIGAGGGMLVNISEDLKRFRAMTEGKTVIMGSATLRSLPGGRPLKNRRNIVLTAHPEAVDPGVETAASIDALRRLVGGFEGEDLFVIGGEAVYRQLLPYCRVAYITKTEISMPAEKYFPNLDALPQWQITNMSESFESGGIKYYYVDYCQKTPDV